MGPEWQKWWTYQTFHWNSDEKDAVFKGKHQHDEKRNGRFFEGLTGNSRD